ncbi:unnamed protein product [Rotaria socialis]|uniref:PiggyBac transposable element-derived protein domain-containing protein n=1 Tax=Rotaria socialis TaxID=392032 RepID=A0A821STT0_9BILA|nr:unnamed protein product [Rotaria socialis]
MNKENVFDDESDSEDEGKVMLNLPDSDVDEIEDQLNGTGLNDDDVYLPHGMSKLMVNQNAYYDYVVMMMLHTIGVPKELVQKKLTAPGSCFMRSGELLMIKFLDKKATGDKEIYVVDSKGTAGILQVERFEKGGVKKFVSKPSSIIDYNRNMGGVDLSDSSLHHTRIDRQSYWWFVKLGIHFLGRLLFNDFVMYRIFVRDTMESTGITRKSLNEFTPPQKRILSVSNSNIPQKLMKVQHLSSKTDYNENRQVHVQQRCVLCRSKQVRKQTIYFCRTCPNKPALCYPDCFDVFHSKIQYKL